MHSLLGLHLLDDVAALSPDLHLGAGGDAVLGGLAGGGVGGDFLGAYDDLIEPVLLISIIIFSDNYISITAWNCQIRCL